MTKQEWKPEDLLGKLVWAWDYDKEGGEAGILRDIVTHTSWGVRFKYLVNGSIRINICPFVPEEHPELFYKGESSDAK
jgi:hypothetical protein